ncbi:polysaccharide deacetylase family protein [Geobacter sp.]|uniref:polysaccharide deacetylase family protein n=1 Tax=Geobacter sp. TaxID=46610 RepID=UPI0027BB099D|nr:polysaccharide deacetylase family protein [Geobacter sp.]
MAAVRKEEVVLPQRVPILMYHSIAGPGEPAGRYSVPVDRFRKQIAFLRRLGFSPYTLDDLAEGRAGGEKPVVITFDDGYRDNLKYALPVLEEYGFKATFFIVSGLAGKRAEWVHGSRELMNWEEIRQVRDRGMNLGAHSRTHKRLSSLDQWQIVSEIEGSRRDIEENTGISVRHFSYPYGCYSASIAETVGDSGFHTACTTDSGFASASPSFMRLRRIEVTGMDSVFIFGCKLIYGDNNPSIKQKILGLLYLTAEMLAWRRMHF